MWEHAVRKVMDYIDNVLIEPDRHWQPHLFETWSYSRWAATEILHLLMDRPYEFPEDVIASFALKMQMYAAEANQKDRSKFQTAADVAEEILEFYLKGAS